MDELKRNIIVEANQNTIHYVDLDIDEYVDEVELFAGGDLVTVDVRMCDDGRRTIRIQNLDALYEHKVVLWIRKNVR